MSDKVKESLLSAYRRLLRPLVRILIRNGLSFGEFAEVVKSVYIESAHQDFALPDRKSSDSRVAILTGLTRKEVKRISDLLKRGDVVGAYGNISNANRATRVLSGWYQDPDFTGPYGIPLELPFERSALSFTELVRRYSGDMPARAMLEELKRVGAVEQLDNGDIKPVTRYYIAKGLDPNIAEYIGNSIHDLAATIEHNVDPDRTAPARFERSVEYDHVSRRGIEDFHSLVKEYGTQFLERLDTWLSGSEVPEHKRKQELTVRMRVGVYLYEGEKSDGESTK